MAHADGANISGRKVRWFITDAVSVLTSAYIIKIQNGYAGTAADAASSVALADIVGSGKMLTADTATGITLLSNVDELKGVGTVSTHGVETSSTSTPVFGNPSINVPGSSTISDLEVTFHPDFSGTDARWASTKQFAASTSVSNGTQVLVLERVQGNTLANKTYNLSLGLIGGLTHAPAADGLQSYSRRLIVSAIIFGIAG